MSRVGASIPDEQLLRIPPPGILQVPLSADCGYVSETRGRSHAHIGFKPVRKVVRGSYKGDRILHIDPCPGTSPLFRDDNAIRTMDTAEARITMMEAARAADAPIPGAMSRVMSKDMNV